MYLLNPSICNHTGDQRKAGLLFLVISVILASPVFVFDTVKNLFEEDEKLYRAIKENQQPAWTYLYNKYYANVAWFVKQNKGDEEDAKDVFQEGVIALWTNIKKGNYQLRAGTRLGSYLIKICKYRWYEKLKNASKASSPFHAGSRQPEVDTDIQQTMIRAEHILQITRLIGRLGAKCREILQLFYYREMNLEDIASRMGYTRETAKNEKYRCMKSLRNKMKTADLT